MFYFSARIFSFPSGLKGFLQKLLGAAFFLILSGSSASADMQAQGKTFNMWTYYDFAPFVTEKEGFLVKKGLIFDLARLLEKKSNGKFRFVISTLPRKRMDGYLRQGHQAVVVFVNPSWMGNNAETKFFWTTKILEDQNEIVSRASGKAPNRVNYVDINSLAGMKIGGVLGRQYRGIDDAVNRGEIIREDVLGEDQNLKKLVAGKIDFLTAPRSMLKFVARELKLDDHIYFSPTPLFSYTRHFMVTRELGDVFDFMENFSKDADKDDHWTALKEKYCL